MKNKLMFIKKDQERKNMKIIEKKLRELLLQRNLELKNNRNLDENYKIIFTKQFLLIREIFEILRNYKKEGNFYEEK